MTSTTSVAPTAPDTPAVGNAPSPVRLRAARTLMAVAAVSALAAAVSAIGVVVAAPAETRMVETWRGTGFLVFAGLFALLALRPLAYHGVWELVLANKVVLTLAGLAYAVTGSADGAGTVVAWDGALSVVLATAYVAARGWTAGPRLVGGVSRAARAAG